MGLARLADTFWRLVASEKMVLEIDILCFTMVSNVF